MTNYDIDEMRRRDFAKDLIDHNKKDSVTLGKDEAPFMAVDIELPDEDFRRIALQAHERDITFNKMVLNMLKDSLQSAENGANYNTKPQLLNEDK